MKWKEVCVENFGNIYKYYTWNKLQLMCPQSVGEVKSAAIKTWISKKLTGEIVRILHYIW